MAMQHGGLCERGPAPFVDKGLRLTTRSFFSSDYTLMKKLTHKNNFKLLLMRQLFTKLLIRGPKFRD